MSSETSFSDSVVFLLSFGNSLKTVYLWFKDAGGNISDATNDSITLDLAPNMIPDTGQTTSYTGTPGEDSDYTINPPSYTDNGNATVTDNVTGLMWQQETTVHSWSNALEYCSDLSLASYSDWRLPTIKEIQQIADYQTTHPVIDSTFFPNTISSSFWTSNTAAWSNDYAWKFSFSNGTNSREEKTRNGNVHCVRGRHLAFGDFVDNGDGTVTDSATGLMWQQSDYYLNMGSGWRDGLNYCEGLSLAGHNDWRLPNIKELFSIVDLSRRDPSINTAYFPNTHSSWDYLSSTTNQSFGEEFLSVWFNDGGIDSWEKTMDGYALCVRTEQ